MVRLCTYTRITLCECKHAISFPLVLPQLTVPNVSSLNVILSTDSLPTIIHQCMTKKTVGGPWWLWPSGQHAHLLVRVRIPLKSRVLFCKLFEKCENKENEAGMSHLKRNIWLNVELINATG